MEDTVEITEDMIWFSNSWFAKVVDKIQDISHVPMLRNQVIDESIPWFRGAIEALYDEPGKRDMVVIAIEILEELRKGH